MAAASVMASAPRDSHTSYQTQYAAFPARPHHLSMGLDRPSSMQPYSTHTAAAQQQERQSIATRSPRPSGSPALDDSHKPFLPSISNLLDIARGERPTHDGSAPSGSQNLSSGWRSPQQLQSGHIDPQLSSAHALPHAGQQNSMTALPPPPPMRVDSVQEGTRSPSTISTGSIHPYFTGSGINNVEAVEQRNPHARMIQPTSAPSQTSMSPYLSGRYTTSPYMSSPNAAPTQHFYSPTSDGYPTPSALNRQKPLPSNFPPHLSAPVLQSTPEGQAPTSNPWEHHHYISGTSQASFPQSQERYVCATCSKAFSRPSSLKIHSHSHTGEKPYKCPHTGCGKAFSVRSNMKRHERGCHSAMAAQMGSQAHIM